MRPRSNRPRPSSPQASAISTGPKLNLSYCDVISEIDGVVIRRDVNPGQ